jgi:cytochrome c peroxidase
LALLQSLWIESLPPPPPDPSNRVADDPRAADLGQRLFFDPRLSGNGAIACATCHQPARHFTDGLARSRAIGTTRRNAPSLIGAAFSPWQYWDGRKDSLWSQALSPLEDPNEHGGNRMQYARLVTDDPVYRPAYEALFGTLPDLSDGSRFPAAAGPVADPALNSAWQGMAPGDRDLINRIFANLGKAIAAYERLLVPGPSRFDAYVAAVLAGTAQNEHLTAAEVRGLRLFLDEAQCLRCHNGPLFTNNEFHNTGVISAPGQIPDKGRIAGVREVTADPFNCLGPYSDAAEDDCAELRFARGDAELLGAVRTPSLRNLDGTAPFMHAGQLASLADALNHYNDAPEAMIGHNEAEPLGLSRRQLRDLEAFLLTLTGAPATPLERLAPSMAARAP